ncbi:MFS transporter [Xenorhabdus bovienii]|uniref:MFS transporter n=1 Tax=Xenorhabdus bovienii TaxID=40576 RepID=UPI00237C5D5A|nr:MFS transporter [Xenorhabdus bovienii]MDE1482958.1 MFS transporter [Xenorhabdus bovienii]MDE9433733.1 MFS transporter [Xenorhabdus bovienii]MDE9443072.1 MFS transporter [Xenorhabdus bovienii]MDE9491359.1 MFS transporter [Xenorhabdus bovienii]MDE9507710.1 MFS transporter [Xenorhabdus bovienii]
MPFVIYIFSLCAFALGLTEFLVIGLVSAISTDFHTSVESVGLTVTAYAVGATIGAPFLTAVTTRWSRKGVMLTTMMIFSIGSLAATFSSSVEMMIVSRFVAGLAHGLFLAVSASVATDLVPPEKSGAAVACVFTGLTLALALGVPIGTYLGSVVSWKFSFSLVTIFGLIGLIGLIFLMPANTGNKNDVIAHPVKSLSYIFSPTLLLGALVTVLGYTGAFTLYTYISPFLYQVTKVSIQTASYMMLIYGGFAAAGNIIGGKMTDAIGADRSVMIILLSLSADLLLMYFFGQSLIIMGILIAIIGAISYAAVPAMQARVISIAKYNVPEAIPVASGLNIAGFNAGIALGSVVGGIIISYSSITYLALGGVVISLAGVCVMILLPRPTKILISQDE